jgi:hypothetical protein
VEEARPMLPRWKKNCDFVSASAEAILKSTDPVRVGNDGNSNSNEGLYI